MQPSDFSKIDAFFSTRGMPKKHSHRAYAIYVGNVEDAIKSQELEDVPVTDGRVRQICASFLTDSALTSYATVVEKQLDSEKRTNIFKTFLSDVGASLVANLLFAGILFVIYISLVQPVSIQDIAERTPSFSSAVDSEAGTVPQLPKD